MNVTDTYVYSAFGITESSSGSSVNPFRFVGQWGYYDDGARGGQSGLSLLGVRYYSPQFGRFWSWDPVPSNSFYNYVDNQVTFATDASGIDKGECDVFLCTERGPGNVVYHRYICVRGPHGGCSGGLYPKDEKKKGVPKVVGKGSVGDLNQSCSSRREGDLFVDCSNKLTNRVSKDTRCAIAAAVCECIRLAVKNPPNYEFPINTCLNFHQIIMSCACQRLKGSAQSECQWILNFRT